MKVGHLFARTKKFDAPIKKSGGVFTGFVRKVGSGFGKLPSLIGPAVIAVAGATAAFVGLNAIASNVNAQFDKIDAMAKFADEVGASVNEMKALNLQAELTGTSQGVLTKGVQRFVRRLGEAKLGIGEGVKGLASLGLSAEKLSNLPLTEQLGIVADKINQNKTAAERAASAYLLFGRQGQELLTFFAGGSEGIAAAADDIDRFGTGISRVDAAQIEIANDAFTRLHTQIEGLWQTLAVKVAPIFTALIATATTGGTEFGNFGTLADAAFVGISKGIGIALDSLQFFFGAAKAGFGFVLWGVSQVLNDFAKIEKALIKLGGKRFDFGIDDLAKSTAKISDDLLEGAERNFADAFSGKLSSQFQTNLNKAFTDAQAVAASQEKPKFSGPSLDFEKLSKVADFGKNILSGTKKFGNKLFGTLKKAASGLAESFVPEESEKTKRAETPSVSAVAFGSSAAISAIINARKQKTGVEGEIQKNRRELAKQTSNTAAIVKALKKGGGVLITI